MLKLVIIAVLLIYILNKVSVFLFRAGGRPQQPPNFGRPPQEGNVNTNPSPRKNKKGGLKGGEYVDYEEVK